MKARDLPQSGQRLYVRTLNFGLSVALILKHVFAILPLLRFERHAHHS